MANSAMVTLLQCVAEQPTGANPTGAIFHSIGMKRSGYFAFNQLPEQTALGYIEEAGGWRTNIYNLPIVGASDGGVYTTAADLVTLWKAFWGNEIVPQDLVEIYATPYVKAGTEGEDTYVRLASIAGILQLMLIYLAQMMPLYNPVVDEHIIYSLLLLGFVFAEQPVTISVQKWRLARKFIQQFAALR